MGHHEIRGYVYILVGATLWGASTVVSKSLFILGVHPAELVLIRLTLSVAILGLCFLFVDRKRLLIPPRDLGYFLILGVAGVAGMQFMYFYAISRIQVGPAVLLQYLSTVWVAIFAFLFQKEPASKVKVCALLLSLAGSYLLIGGYRIDLLKLNLAGVVAGFLSSLFFAFYTLFGEKGLKRYDPWIVVLYGFGFAAAFYWIVSPPARIVSSGYPPRIWAAFLYITIFSTLIPFGLYFKGIDRIRATRAGITSTWEPVVAAMTAYLVLGEVLHPLQVLGGVAVIAAVILLQLAREKTGPSSPMELRGASPSGKKPSLEG